MDRSSSWDDIAFRLYEAAAEPEHWPGVIRALCHQVDSLAGSLLAWDRRDGRLAFVATAGIDPAVQTLYEGYYGAIDPVREAIFALGVGEIFQCHKVFSDDFVNRNEFFRDFQLPVLGVRYATSVKLAPDTDMSIGITFGRNRRYDDDHARAFRLLIPHAARAVQVSRRFMQLQATGQSLDAAWDRAGWGIVITDALGRVLAANAEAERRLTAADGLCTIGSRLSAGRPAEDERLAALIHRTALESGEKGAAEAGGALAIARPSGRRPLHLLAAPLAGSAADALHFQRPSVIIFVSDPEHDGAAPAKALRSRYGLTPAEAEVALSLAAGLSTGEIAEARQTSRDTVRVQAKAVRDKSGAQRQAELVRLILNLPGLSIGSPET